MGRKVYVSSDMSVDERLIEVAEQNPTAALIWPWLITFFDDWGRAEAAPRRVKAQVFPSIPTVTVTDVEEAIDLFAGVGLIQIYHVGDKRYMAIPSDKWFKYQTHIRTSKRTNDESRYPPAPESPDKESASERNSAQVSADERTCTASPSTLPPFHPSPSMQQKKETRESDDSMPPDDHDWATLRRWLNENCLPAFTDSKISHRWLPFLKDMGQAVIQRACEEAALQGKGDVPSYVLRILASWQTAKVTKVEDAEQLLSQFTEQKRKPRDSPKARGPTSSNVFLHRDGPADDDKYAHIYKKFAD